MAGEVGGVTGTNGAAGVTPSAQASLDKDIAGIMPQLEVMKSDDASPEYVEALANLLQRNAQLMKQQGDANGDKILADLKAVGKPPKYSQLSAAVHDFEVAKNLTQDDPPTVGREVWGALLGGSHDKFT